MIGAVSTGFASQNVVVRVDAVDGDVLKRKLAEEGRSGAIAPAVILAADHAPKAAIDVAIPLVVKEMKKYGVTARITSSDAPPAQGARKRSEFWPGIAVGGGIAAVAFGVGWGVWKLLLKRIFT